MNEVLPDRIPQAALRYISKVRNLPVIPYLTSPFAEREYSIDEGWFYSDEEYSIHGLWGHAGIDYRLPKGTAVFAAAPGWAMSSYYRRPFFDQDGRSLLHQGKRIEMGYGYFVQIYHPDVQRYTLYAHLQKVNEKIPYSPARRLKSGKIVPANIRVSPQEMPGHPQFVWVRRSDVIGWVGDSGICWGYDDFPLRPDPDKFPSWDEQHLHFQEFTRDLKDGSVSSPRDPFDIYGLFDKYPDSNRPENFKNIGPKNLWV